MAKFTDRKEMVVTRSWGQEGGAVSVFEGYRFEFGKKKVLEMDDGDGCPTVVNATKSHLKRGQNDVPCYAG